MFLFEPVAKGKNREPGLQENFVRNFTGRQPPPGVVVFINSLGLRPELLRARCTRAIYPLKHFFAKKVLVSQVRPV